MEQFLVQIIEKNTLKVFTRFMSKNEIINRIDFMDCSDDADIKVYDTSTFGEIKELKVHGIWHDADNPLFIKVTDQEDNIVFSGYGTDH